VLPLLLLVLLVLLLLLLQAACGVRLVCCQVPAAAVAVGPEALLGPAAGR
jgi:hypothetical protein